MVFNLVGFRAIQKNLVTTRKRNPVIARLKILTISAFQHPPIYPNSLFSFAEEAPECYAIPVSTISRGRGNEKNPSPTIQGL